MKNSPEKKLWLILVACLVLSSAASAEDVNVASFANGSLLAAAAKEIALVVHQGLHGKGVPGNTVEAISAAYSNGWRQVETDFWRLEDGSFACMHDPRAGARIRKPYRVPSLAEVLACVPTNGVLQCEIKGGYGEAYATEFMAAVKRAGLGPKQITVSSASARDLADFRRRFPAYRTIWLQKARTDYPRELDGILETARKGGFAAICPCGRADKPTTFAREHADRIRAAGFDVCLWGVHTPEKLAFAREVGAVAVTTDRPTELSKYQSSKAR